MNMNVNGRWRWPGPKGHTGWTQGRAQWPHNTHTHTHSKRDKGKESEREGNTIEGISNFDVYWVAGTQSAAYFSGQQPNSQQILLPTFERQQQKNVEHSSSLPTFEGSTYIHISAWANSVFEGTQHWHSFAVCLTICACCNNDLGMQGGGRRANEQRTATATTKRCLLCEAHHITQPASFVCTAPRQL